MITRKPGDDTHEPSEPSEPTTVETEVETCLLTVRYWANGRPAFNTFTRSYAKGEAYRVTSPAMTGYRPDRASVEGTISENTTVDVTYAVRSYTLTVRYLYEDGATAAPSHTETLNYGDSYRVVTPGREGYEASRSVVSGTMRARDTEITVIYTSDEFVEIDDYGTALGLGGICLNAGESIE